MSSKRHFAACVPRVSFMWCACKRKAQRCSKHGDAGVGASRGRGKKGGERGGGGTWARKQHSVSICEVDLLVCHDAQASAGT